MVLAAIEREVRQPPAVPRREAPDPPEAETATREAGMAAIVTAAGGAAPLQTSRVAAGRDGTRLSMAAAAQHVLEAGADGDTELDEAANVRHQRLQLDILSPGCLS